MGQDFEASIKKMIEEHLKGRGITNNAVLDAMRKVPRQHFVPENLQNSAYEDAPLPIGMGQTISQPYIVAYMTEMLEPRPGMKILEIGTGSGYQTAVLAQLGCEVYSVEILEEHADSARDKLAALHYENVKIKHGNGQQGWPEESPFDAILVTAAPAAIPPALPGQLKDGGTMIVPVGTAGSVQWLKCITKKDGELTENSLLPVRFVPMI